MLFYSIPTLYMKSYLGGTLFHVTNVFKNILPRTINNAHHIPKRNKLVFRISRVIKQTKVKQIL